MKKFLTVCTMLAGMPGIACADNLEGFRYGKETAPTGKEWESVEDLSLNKEQPHAWFFSFENVEQARKVLPENSKYWKSLNGTWKFHWVPNPDERPADFYKEGFDASSWDSIPVPSSWNIVGIQKDGTQKYGTPIYVNQPVIFQHRRVVDDWKGGVMRTPPTHWTTYKHRNEVGSYLRTFTVPADWNGREVFISFDGVDSFFYLWINGQYVGFSKNSRNTAEFNITSYLKKDGENTLAVEVYRSSDGSFLEAQDMFRLPGIFRTVALQSRPAVRVRDLVVKPDLDENYENGVLNISAELLNVSKKNAKDLQMHYTLYANELYVDENTLTGCVAASQPVNLEKLGGKTVANTELKMASPRKWSAEAPYRYTLVGELKDRKGNVIETVSAAVGFRKVEIKDTPADKDEFGLAGRYYYINGMPVKLKGVNRHESHPEVGHAVTREMQTEEVMMMKRANINHVRNSHYPCDPYWYFLCNKYGIYLEDEANIESHEYYYGKESLSHPVEWRKAHVARVMEMVHADVNNPCVVIWSLGNEAGPGKNFVEAYKAIKAFDTTRPVQYERNNDIVDMGSNQYPSIGWTRGAVTGKYDIKYPFHISEYAHSMGNAVGNLIDYWNAIESTNFFCGGAIWDWVDQSMYNYEPDGTRYLAYGGNFGDTPNDGQFVMNGIIFGDREPKPQYYEVKKVYQYVGVKAVDMKKGLVEIFNKNYYEPLNDYMMVWSLWKDGKRVTEDQPLMGPRMVLGPRQKMNYRMPYDYDKLNAESEYFVKVQFLLAKDMPWAKMGYVQAEEQLLVKSAEGVPAISTVAGNGTITEEKAQESGITTFRGEGFEVQFDMAQGTIHKLVYGGETVIAAGGGPRLNAFRAFVSNDNWCYQPWFNNGLHNLRHHAEDAQIVREKNGNVVLSFTVVSQAPNAATLQSKNGRYDSGIHTLKENTDRPFGDTDFKFVTNQMWTIYPDGSIELQSAITSNNSSLVLARLGYEMMVPAALERFDYYGRGPVDNYNDRKTGQFIEVYKSTVAEQFVNFPKPQQMGNHEETRWASLSNGAGKGLLVVNEKPYAVSVASHSSMDLTMATHPHRLPKGDVTYVNIDAMVTGLGGNSCGQGGPLAHDRAFGTPTRMGFILRPTVARGGVHVTVAGEKPILMTRQKNGDIVIESGDKDAILLYKVGKERKAHVYEGPIAFRNGGTITVYTKVKPDLKVTMTYPKIEKINTEVVFASSEESGEGNATHLTDGDANTIWHTMYSVTVAKYPHWVDFDAGDTKTLKGFAYMPRQDSNNGNIKDYEIYVSQDGQNWGEAVMKGTFENNRKEKKVMLKTPVKARYFRFRALSSQDGQDFASGAEFSILAD
ncbi:MAG: discoidin domain-containing protein [Bacteroidaceae bacterium]|nr:discoidin domain-containing protein [Bacteroidaceae bacterium]